jgi:hypothetical protein
VNFEIIPTTRFEKEVKKISRVYPRFKKDIEKLAFSLATQPIQGSHLGHGIYKIRIPITGKATGKSYGARTIHVVFSADKKVYLLSVYDKSEKKDLSSSEVKELVQIVKAIKSL